MMVAIGAMAGGGALALAALALAWRAHTEIDRAFSTFAAWCALSVAIAGAAMASGDPRASLLAPGAIAVGAALGVFALKALRPQSFAAPLASAEGDE